MPPPHARKDRHDRHEERGQDGQVEHAIGVGLVLYLVLIIVVNLAMDAIGQSEQRLHGTLGLLDGIHLGVALAGRSVFLLGGLEGLVSFEARDV